MGHNFFARRKIGVLRQRRDGGGAKGNHCDDGTVLVVQVSSELTFIGEDEGTGIRQDSAVGIRRLERRITKESADAATDQRRPLVTSGKE